MPFLQQSSGSSPVDDLPSIMLVPKPLILFIDAYDSFSSNIISLLETSLSCTVRTIKIDDNVLSTPSLLHAELSHYVAVVCGPGPGHPANEKDVGIMKRIWRLCDEETLPVLGICLGFQSLCLEFGGEVRRLRAPMHGIVRKVRHCGDTGTVQGQENIFGGLRDIKATLYHSLCVDIGQDCVEAADWDNWKWSCSPKALDLMPLAWVEAEEGWNDERILIAVRHRTKPFWGLQYHPESIRTNFESHRVIKNWFKQAQRWNRTFRKHKLEFDGPIRAEVATRTSLLSQTVDNQILHNSETIFRRCSDLPWELSFHAEGLNYVYRSRRLDMPDGFSIARFMEMHGNTNGNSVLLESSNVHVQPTGSADVRGRYSIIGMDARDSTRIEYRVTDEYLTIFQRRLCFLPEEHRAEKVPLKPYGGIWQFISHYLKQRQVVGQEGIPFWGGFMGYTTYELGLESINVESGERSRSRPDLCFAWITRSIVVDHLEGRIYIQSLGNNCYSNSDDTSMWLDDMVHTLRHSFKSRWRSRSEGPLQSISDLIAISTPSDAGYESKVSQCQDYIRSGDSYELCLTDQTTVTLPRVDLIPRESLQNNFEHEKEKQDHECTPDPSWLLYKTLCNKQPAPFASYFRLGSATFISSSPERFLTWDNKAGLCSLRPMKGTVKKSSSVTNLFQATALLQVPKEQAENLMIVDLVRHDLHSVLGSGNVSVPRLMVVEEYASVFQMISIVEGRILPAAPISEEGMNEQEVEEAEKRSYTGIDVLAASLPPGSMTGAPKKRSCEILREIEGGKDRSLYSGVVGYMDVGGRGDFSVTIRSMFRWDDEGKEEGKEVWHIGAGGAVTALSTPEGEKEEMLTKLSGTLGVFG